LYGSIGQADDGDAGQAVGGIDFYLDDDALEADDCARVDA